RGIVTIPTGEVAGSNPVPAPIFRSCSSRRYEAFRLSPPIRTRKLDRRGDFLGGGTPMANPFLRLFNRAETPQSAPIPGREPAMVPNRAGGWAFEIDEWARLDRFLILGTEGSTYYAGEREMTAENVGNLRACIAQDGPRVVARVLAL